MRIVLNIDELYRLMRLYGLETVQQLSKVTEINAPVLYKVIEKGVVSKETYWKLAQYFECHVEDLQIPCRTD
ncbi:MAG: helix-turn-helix domain-containing protein [Ruminococcus sp.]|nr:helix-turn-helix domain-containing protein [Ruminococcus sp.]